MPRFSLAACLPRCRHPCPPGIVLPGFTGPSALFSGPHHAPSITTPHLARRSPTVLAPAGRTNPILPLHTSTAATNRQIPVKVSFRPSESLLSQKLHGNQIHHETPSPRCLFNPDDTERPRGLILITPVATFPPHFFFRRAQLGKRTVSLTESQPADATPRAQKAKVGDVYE